VNRAPGRAQAGRRPGDCQQPPKLKMAGQARQKIQIFILF
jgi:hypothetical protein